MAVHVFGIRHHGPGCARALRAGLEGLKPDAVLVEGPPDAEDVLPIVLHDEIKPPVALLVYRPDSPQRAVFYPFTIFSPEWQALRYGLEREIPTRFMDLPQAHHLARERPEKEAGSRSETAPTEPPESRSDTVATGNGPQAVDVREDPLGLLARAAGYSDHELWWEHRIERRRDTRELFAGIMEAMKALRAEDAGSREEDELREAYMRQSIRAAIKEGHERIAVVCGAWHAPVLAELGPAKADADLLRGLPKVKVAATWIPWTYSRLSYRSGYGAGVTSPGWYEHLWTSSDRAVTRWAVSAARLLRDEDLDASSAEVIETVRLAETLAAIRDVPGPGLVELNEAVLTVLCRGALAPMALIRDRLEIGEGLGAVPADTPGVPLQRDLEEQQRKLRLPASDAIKTLDIDLRDEGGLARSRLLHRVSLLNIPWGEPQTVRGKAGTFHEVWKLQWCPEFAVQVIEASVWGRTIEAAVGAFVCNAAAATDELPALTQLLDRTVLADLPDAIERLLVRVRDVAAVSADLRHLMEALPPLARVARYGDVRKTKVEQIRPIINSLFERVVVGLPGACGSLDDEAAARMVASMSGVGESLDLLEAADQQAEWYELLGRLLASDGLHGLVRGRCCRMLLDKGRMDGEALHRTMRLALATATPAPQAAAWIAGFVQGSALLLLHHELVWSVLDAWLRELSAEAFVEVLPLLRRAFSGFAGPERRAMGEKVKALGRGAAPSPTRPAGDGHIDLPRARRVLPALAHILGVPYDADR